MEDKNDEVLIEKEIDFDFVKIETIRDYMLAIFCSIYGAFILYLSLICVQDALNSNIFVKYLIAKFLVFGSLLAVVGPALLTQLLKRSFFKKNEN